MFSKPLYRIPSLAEINANAGSNGLVAVSTFSGCGGSSLGLKMAGYKVSWANEFVPEAARTYGENHEGTYLSTSDIRTVTGKAVRRESGIGDAEIDLLEGSPPCASFSMSGAREKHWGKVKAYSDQTQRTDDLFFEYTRLLGELRPRAFVAENVQGLIIGKAKGFFKKIHAELQRQGYNVAAAVVDSKWCGVPQSRKRLFFVGFRDDLLISPVFPNPLPYWYSINEALADAPTPTAAETSDNFIRGSIYPLWLTLRPGETHKQRFNLVRPDPRKPAPTILASHGAPLIAGLTHWEEPRKFHITELRRLGGFPDDFALTGSFEQRWERIGRSVPPPMMNSVASAIATRLAAAASRAAA